MYGLQNWICSFFFLSLIVAIQIASYFWMTFLFLIMLLSYPFLQKKRKHSLLTIALFAIGFFLYLSIGEYLDLGIIFSRVALIVILLCLSVLSLLTNSTLQLYWNKPKWNNTIRFPFIWSGIHETKIKYFLMIAITINIVSLFPIHFLSPFPFLNILLTAVLFSIVNATLEECIWRGVLLNQFAGQMGVKWSVFLTSVGFGLQHFSLGFSWFICLLFAVGGFFYAGITIISRSIIPALIWHFVLNLLMIWSGMISFS